MLLKKTIFIKIRSELGLAFGTTGIILCLLLNITHAYVLQEVITQLLESLRNLPEALEGASSDKL